MNYIETNRHILPIMPYQGQLVEVVIKDSLGRNISAYISREELMKKAYQSMKEQIEKMMHCSFLGYDPADKKDYSATAIAKVDKGVITKLWKFA